MLKPDTSVLHLKKKASACASQDITAVWASSHAHLRPLSEHLAFPVPAVDNCPRCGCARAFYLTAHLRFGVDTWRQNAHVLYCPDCSSYHYISGQETGMGIGLSVTEVNARLWSASPTFLNIEPTTRCNFRCWYCIGRSMEQADIRTDQFARMLDHFPAVKTIALVGEGEPLLHTGFFDMVLMARARGIKIMITSNGSQFSESVIRNLCETGVTYVSVSIDSINPDTFADSRPPGGLDSIWRGIAALRRYRDEHDYQYPKIGLKGTLFSHTVDELPQIISEATKYGMEIFEGFQPLNPMHTYLSAYPADKKRHLEESRAVASKISLYSRQASPELEFVADFCKREQIEFDKNGMPNGLRPGCDEQWVYSLLSGDITPCCQIKKPISPAWSIFSHDMDVILGDTAYENLRFNLWNGIFPCYCAGCYKTGEKQQ